MYLQLKTNLFKSAHKWIKTQITGTQCLQEKFCKAEQDCFGVWGQADTYLKIEDLCPIKPLVNFHKCFISCVAECQYNIYLIQLSDRHNSEV